MTSDILSPAELEHLLSLDTSTDPSLAEPVDSPLVRLLANIDRTQLSQLMTERQCVPGEVLCWEGDVGDAMYLIRAGRIVVLKGSLESPTILAYRGPGEVIGEMALLEGQPRSATNIALDNARLLSLSREMFQEWLTSSPSVGIAIMATLSARLRTSDDVRTSAIQVRKRLTQQVTQLEDEKEQLLELQRVRQETSDLVVHDLRNPLGVISGSLSMLELVLPEDVYQDNAELLDLAVTACGRMQRLVDSLLDVAKFSTGEMPLELTNVNFGVLLDNVAHHQSVTAVRQNVVIETSVADDLPLVLVDQEKMERVLINLMDNALKYSPDDGHITLAAQVEHVRGELIISVTDEGPGIPEDQRTRIFERFAQVSDTERPRRRGFGLGLTFCQLTVQAHGGEIWVEPGPNGAGSRFAFTLPLTFPE